LLRHVVENTLRGDSGQLTEYSLGVDVFHRGESFDPAADTIVRVQTRRLRAKLAKYYASDGRNDPVVIELPKGQYAAVFAVRSRKEQTATARAGRDSELADNRLEGVAQLRAGLPPAPPLPAACTSFIGREQELTEITRLLEDREVRLLTLTGAGGSGKTRLALRAASKISSEFPGGVYMVPLASVTDPETVAPTIAQAVGLRRTGGTPLPDALQHYLCLSVQAPILLFLDNFEQVTAAAPLLTALLATCPHLKILVTSRSVLHLSGEHDYPVPPLSTSDPDRLPPLEELARAPAVALFVQRAGAVDPAFTLKESNAPAVARICRRLDGLPLAIELAAARIKILPPAAMLSRLCHSLDLLTAGQLDLPRRHQTLRATIDWSHGLLNAAEQKLFRRLAVFAGGCTLESTEAVCNARRDLGPDVLDGISSMIDKNLLQRVEQESGEVRFRMLETIREYAFECLSGSGELEFTRRAYAAYSIVLAEEGAAETVEKERAKWLAVWDAEHDNLRDALDWLIETDNGEWALRLATALLAFWERREHLMEGRNRLEAVLKLDTAVPPTPQRARAAFYAAIFADQQGDFEASLRLFGQGLEIYRILRDRHGIAVHLSAIGNLLAQTDKTVEAQRYLEESLATCRELDDPTATARVLTNLAVLVTETREYESARFFLKEALSLFRELGDASGVGWSLNHLGDVALGENDLTEASRYYREGYDVFRRAGDRWGMGRSLTDLGRLALVQEDLQTARSRFEQALSGFAELGHTRGVSTVLEGLACLAVRKGDFERALKLGGAAEGLRQQVGAPNRPRQRASLKRALEPAWKGTGLAMGNTHWSAGLRMPLERAIRYAFGLPTMPEPTAPRN
jgi:predicted ATPase